MTKREKFLFEYSFDEREEPEAAPSEIDVMRELSERQAEVDAAFQRGRDTGLTEAETSNSKRLISATESMVQQLESIERARAEIERNTVQSVVDLALAILRKILPSLARYTALSDIESTFTECLRRVLDEPRIVLRVADGTLDLVRERVDDAARRSGFHGKVVLLAEDGMGPADCRMEWADGGAEINLDRIWGEIEEAVRRTQHAGAASVAESAAATSAPLN